MKSKINNPKLSIVTTALLCLLNQFIYAQFQPVGASGNNSWRTQTFPPGPGIPVGAIGIGNFPNSTQLPSLLTIDGNLVPFPTGESFRTNAPAGLTAWRMFSANVAANEKFNITNFNATNDVGLTTVQNGFMAFGTNSTERMRITAAGNVGIGLSLPASKLQLHDVTGGALAVQFTNTTTGSALATNGLRIGIISTGEAFVQQNQAQSIKISTGGPNPGGTPGVSERVIITGGGTLTGGFDGLRIRGANNFPPGGNLDLWSSTSGATHARYGGSGIIEGAGNRFHITSTNSTLMLNANNPALTNGLGETPQIRFNINYTTPADATNNREAGRIADNFKWIIGRTIINTATYQPPTRLEIFDNNATTAQLRLTQTQANPSVSGTGVFTDFQATANGDLLINPFNNNAARRVGIGLSSTDVLSRTLDVQGNGRFRTLPAAIDNNLTDFVVSNSLGELFIRQMNPAAFGDVKACTTPGPVINQVTKWTATSPNPEICNSILFDNGTQVGVDNISPVAKLDINGNLRIGTIPAATTPQGLLIRNNSNIVEQIALPFAGNVFLNGNGQFITVGGGGVTAANGLRIASGSGSVELGADLNSTPPPLIHDTWVDMAGHTLAFVDNSGTGIGRIGIGVSQPVAKLDIRETSPSFTGPLMNFQRSSNQLFTIHNDASWVAANSTPNVGYLFQSEITGPGSNNVAMKISARASNTAMPSFSGIEVNTIGDVSGESRVFSAFANNTPGTIGNTTGDNIGFSAHISVNTGGANYGIKCVMRGNGAATINYGGWLEAQGGANSYGLIVRSGGVGVNTPTPDNTNYQVDVVGAVRATGGFSTSDRKYKKDIQPLVNSTDRIKQLQGVSFVWDRQAYPEHFFPEGNQLGLIAQEVWAVVPEVVSTDIHGNKSMDYGRLVALLVEGIKEQQATIENLQSRITQLENQPGMKQNDDTDQGNSGNKWASGRPADTQPSGYLLGCHPNPFNEGTTIEYTLPEQVSSASIIIYDMAGRQVRKVAVPVTAGKGSVDIRAGELYEGMFVYALLLDGKITESKQMVLTK